MSNVIWTEPALFNLRVIRDYIAQFNPYAADKVANEIIDTSEQLVHFPLRGRAVRGINVREAVTSYPYIIRYRVQGETIFILRIRHMARRPA